MWETLSGRVEPDEQPLDALAREIEEEVGSRCASMIARWTPTSRAATRRRCSSSSTAPSG
ncbi:MAG: NUDIX domain-containing protein [Sandaracinaceae bacterium]|nr:NUDIX domain-containing protein [Sandaracinaceae bacterium]